MEGTRAWRLRQALVRPQAPAFRAGPGRNIDLRCFPAENSASPAPSAEARRRPLMQPRPKIRRFPRVPAEHAVMVRLLGREAVRGVRPHPGHRSGRVHVRQRGVARLRLADGALDRRPGAGAEDRRPRGLRDPQEPARSTRWGSSSCASAPPTARSSRPSWASARAAGRRAAQLTRATRSSAAPPTAVVPARSPGRWRSCPASARPRSARRSRRRGRPRGARRAAARRAARRGSLGGQAGGDPLQHPGAAEVEAVEVGELAVARDR